MFNLEKFIADSVTSRPVSMFAADIEANRKTLIAEIKNKMCHRWCRINRFQLHKGGAAL